MTRLQDWIWQSKRYQVYRIKGDEPFTYLVRGPRGQQWKMVPYPGSCNFYQAINLTPEKAWDVTPLRRSIWQEQEFARLIEEAP